MKKILLILILLLALPVALGVMQDDPAPRMEITGVNATDLPMVLVTINVYDNVNQPMRGLTEENFELTGALAGQGQIVDVQNITDDNLPFATLLVIDVSSSMTGLPINRAREAAQLYVNSIGENNPVAIYTFGGDFTLVQDYTTDKAALLAAIDSFEIGGPTPLYQAAFNAVELAVNAPTPRRAVILLSDGAEYGDMSDVGREAAREAAQIRGVPVYTIGLGFGIDRSYLEELSGNTNARFVESPDPDQLTQIYGDLAGVLQSQYVLTLDVPVAPDGTQYPLALSVSTPLGSASAQTTLRAPIPTPIVEAPLFDAPISEITEVTPVIRADDELVSTAVQIDGSTPETFSDAPYTFTIDPATLAPGAHDLTIGAVDAEGDIGTVTATFEVAALPPVVAIASEPEPNFTAPQSVTLDVTGQTPGDMAVYSIDGGPLVAVEEAPFAFEIDPATLAPGEHTLTIQAVNEGGGSTLEEVTFTVGVLPPEVIITGLDAGQLIDAPTPFQIEVSGSQTPLAALALSINGIPFENIAVPQVGSPSNAVIDPILLDPGAAQLTVRAQNEGGGVAQASLDFEVAALPPMTVFGNLTDGETLDENRVVDISFISQTPVIHVGYFIDDVDLAHRMGQPWDFELDVLDLGPGPHTLRVAPETSSGQTAFAEISFIVSDGPSLTATALAPTATPTPTNTPTPTATPDVPATLTIEANFTRSAQETVAANTQVAEDALATERSEAATGTLEARATNTAAAAALSTQAAQDDATATIETGTRVQATEVAIALAATESIATQDSQATATQIAHLQRPTTEARQTATSEAQETATAEEERNNAVRATATALVEQAAATSAARATLTVEAAQATESREAEQAATATALVEQATADAQATNDALDATATADAQATETRDAELAASATAFIQQATADAQATETRDAELAATATAHIQQATADAQATLEVQATAAARETQSAQVELNAQGTADAQATRDVRAANAQATQQANAAATSAAQDASASETAESATREAGATATINAQATLDTQLTAIATEEPSEAPTQLAQIATDVTEEPTVRPTSTPQGTLVPIEAESQTADLTEQISQALPLMIIVVVIVIILLVIFLIIRGGRSKRR